MKEKKLTIAKYVLAIISIIILSVMYYLNKPIVTPQVIYVPKGSINQIISQLQRNNINVCKLDSILLRFIGSPQSGWIDLKSTHNTKADFLYKLATSKAALEKITLIPGETTYIFLSELSEKLHLNFDKLVEEFNEQSPVAEGAFLPNTYKLPKGLSEHRVIKILLDISDKKMREISKKIFGIYNQNKWFRFVAIASIIQKEAANTQEMPIISSVIYNRIKKGMKLQMDGTLNYGKYSHIKVTPQRIRDDESIYNTYKIKGIPSVPVCNVSIAAIQAAIFPKNTNYLYFMKSKKGTHNFSCNYSTHIRNIKHATK